MLSISVNYALLVSLGHHSHNCQSGRDVQSVQETKATKATAASMFIENDAHIPSSLGRLEHLFTRHLCHILPL